MNSELVISKGSLKKDQLLGKIALITGAAGGIGYETARSLVWLGVKIIIVDIDKNKGKSAEARLNKEFGLSSSMYIEADIGDERQVKKLVKKVHESYDHIDIIINNATITPIGAAPEYFMEKLNEFHDKAHSNQLSKGTLKQLPVDKIEIYYKHQIDLLRGYEKNPEKVKEYTALMENWINAIIKFKELAQKIFEQ